MKPVKMKHHKTVLQSQCLIVQFVSVLVLISGLISAQKAEPNIEYKTVLRMKLNMDVNPMLYLDEPKSAQMNQVHQSCVNYLDLADRKAADKKLFVQAQIIKKGAEKFSDINYDREIPVKIKRNIRYNYFSSVSGRD